MNKVHFCRFVYLRMGFRFLLVSFIFLCALATKIVCLPPTLNAGTKLSYFSKPRSYVVQPSAHPKQLSFLFVRSYAILQHKAHSSVCFYRLKLHNYLYFFIFIFFLESNVCKVLLCIVILLVALR